MNTKALILAAGAGTRMKSDKPKVAHEVLGKPLVRWVVDAAREAGIADIVSVLGHMSERVAPLVEGDTRIVIQEHQLGTGDAVNAAREAMAGPDGAIEPGSIVVLSGDCPLITADTIAALAAKREVLPHRRAGDLPQRQPRGAGAFHGRRRRGHGRELARPAGPGFEGHAAPHQRAPYGRGGHHVGSRHRVDRP